MPKQVWLSRITRVGSHWNSLSSVAALGLSALGLGHVTRQNGSRVSADSRKRRPWRWHVRMTRLGNKLSEKQECCSVLKAWKIRSSVITSRRAQAGLTPFRDLQDMLQMEISSTSQGTGSGWEESFKRQHLRVDAVFTVEHQRKEEPVQGLSGRSWLVFRPALPMVWFSTCGFLWYDFSSHFPAP